MKKTLCILLALLLCLSLCACQASNPSTEQPTEPSAPEDFSDVTVSIALFSDKEPESLWICEQIEEKFGCKVELVAIDFQQAYETTILEMLQEGTLPTMFMGSSAITYTGSNSIPSSYYLPIDVINENGDAGAFVNFLDEDVLAKMPNFKALFIDNAQNNARYMTSVSDAGAHYVLPQYGLDPDVERYWFYNETVFQEAGVTWSGDPDGFLDMLRQLKAYAPDAYPLIGGADSIMSLLNYVGCAYNINSPYAAYDWDAGEWYIGATADAYYDMLCMFQIAYREELIKPGMFYMHSGSMQEPIMNRRGFLFHSWMGWPTMYNAAFAEIGKDDHLIPATTPVGPNGMTLENPDFLSHTGTIISNSDPRAAACAIAIMDWMYDTSEGGGAWLNTVGDPSMLTTDENGRYLWITEQPYSPTDRYYAADTYGIFLDTLAVCCCPKSPIFTFNAEEQQAQDIGAQIGYFKAPPELPFMNEALHSQYFQMRQDIHDATAKFITENWTREQFDAWAAALNTKYADVLAFLNG